MDRQANLYLPEVRTLPSIRPSSLSLYHPALYNYNPILGGTLSDQQAPPSTRANRLRHYRPASCGIKKKRCFDTWIGYPYFLPYTNMPVALFPHTPLFSLAYPCCCVMAYPVARSWLSGMRGVGKKLCVCACGGFSMWRLPRCRTPLATTTITTATRTTTNAARQHGATRTTLDCWLQLLIGQAL